MAMQLRRARSAATTSTWKTTYHLPFWRVRIADCGLLGISRCQRLDLARHTDDADPSGLAERQAIADAEVGGLIAARGTEAGLLAPLKSGEERLEALIQP